MSLDGVKAGRARCSCGGVCQERVGYVHDDDNLDHLDRCPWVWFECADCEVVTQALPITPGVAILVTGMMPK